MTSMLTGPVAGRFLELLVWISQPKRVVEMGVTPMGGTPADVTSYIASESPRWAELVKSAGIKLD